MINDHDNVASYLATLYSAGFFLVLTFLALYAGLSLLAGFLLFVALLCASAYLWGRLSTHGVSVEVSAPSHRVYPGQEIAITFTLKNDKFLPLLWLEWLQAAPPNRCLTAPAEFDRFQGVLDEEREGKEWVLCRRFSFIKWYATLSWTSQFVAERRGVYRPQSVLLHTGDGFGLGVQRALRPLISPPTFVVYPRRVPVTTTVFFKNSWSASTGSQGTIEDVTVLRGTRDYLPTDSFKRINWRLAARSDELSVNVYDRIAPRSVCFFIDTATFAPSPEDCATLNDPQDNPAFEETLSVVASIIEALFAQNMTVALYLSTSGESEALSVDLEQSSLADCLLALSLCNCNDSTAQFSQHSMAAALSGQMDSLYYVCYDGQAQRFTPLFEGAGISRFSVITHQELTPTQANAIDRGEINLYTISDFQRR